MNEVLAGVFFFLAAVSAAALMSPLLLCGMLEFVCLVSDALHRRNGAEVKP